MDNSTHESRVREIGAELYRLAGYAPPTLFDPRGVRGRLLRKAIEDEGLRTALFQFVDVLPALDSAASIACHFHGYLSPHAGRLGGLWQALFALGGRPFAAKTIRRAVVQLARQFVAEENPAGIRRAIGEIGRIPAGVTVDAVGEAVLGETESEAYAARYLALLDILAERRSELRGEPPIHLSIKLSALTAHFDALDEAGARRRVLARLRPILDKLRLLGGCLTVDMEQYEHKPLILSLFRDLVETEGDGRWLPAIALQAYLKDSEDDLRQLIDWARQGDRRIAVRLVKGAYWDTEVALARQRNWPLPVFADKAETDANYERLTALLFDHADLLRPAIASHNLRSLSHAIAAAEAKGISASDWEVQMLYGMAEPLRHAVARLGVPLRLYLPVGELLPGVAYLIRRLLENTADTSILRQAYVEGADLDELLAPPPPLGQPQNVGWVRCARPEALPVAMSMGRTVTHRAASSMYSRPIGGLRRASKPQHVLGSDGDARLTHPTLGEWLFTNLPLRDFSRPEPRAAFQRALDTVRAEFGKTWELAVEGVPPQGAALHVATNPACPDDVLGRVALADVNHGERAVQNALKAFPAWRDTPPEQRIALCRKAASLMEARRDLLAAREVLEAGKNWREADADVAEAVDYLRYYAVQMEDLAGWKPTVCFPGEINHCRYEPRGVAVVIPPWNFPLAILTGMSAAALVAGNTVILKPATPAVLVAQQFQAVLREAGFPGGVCQLLPGSGESLGSYLVGHPQVHLIAFTGSREVGLEILRQAHTPASGQSHVKQVVCEMGGKNAILVDEDADLDEVVQQTLLSAFGYQGQKCSAASRLIAVGTIHDRLVERLAAALDSHAYGPPEDPAFLFGPLINRQAREKALAYLDIGRREGRLRYLGQVPEQGCYAPPAIFTEIRPHHRLAREEIFGPILAVLRAPSFAAALQMAEDGDYALTGGVFTRLPAHLELAREQFRVGNLYLNRRITGARVGVQPFGGVKLSGTGVQAGGPDYLKQFLWMRTVSENTLRHGFVPPDEAETTPTRKSFLFPSTR